MNPHTFWYRLADADPRDTIELGVDSESRFVALRPAGGGNVVVLPIEEWNGVVGMLNRGELDVTGSPCFTVSIHARGDRPEDGFEVTLPAWNQFWRAVRTDPEAFWGIAVDGTAMDFRQDDRR